MKIDDRTAEILQPWFPSLPLDEVRLEHGGPVCWFVRSILRQGAMTIDPYVFFGRHRYDPAGASSLALLAHELRHVQQYRERGRLGFLARYLLDLAGNRFRYSATLPLEAECYALQAQVSASMHEAPAATSARVPEVMNRSSMPRP